MKRGMQKRLVFSAILAVVALLMLAEEAFAQENTTITLKPIENEIRGLEFAEFELEIVNAEPQAQVFNLDFGINPLWSIISTPAYRLQLKSGDTGSFKIFAKARSLIPYQYYTIPFTVSYGEQTVQRALSIKYGDITKDPKEYKPTVLIRPETPSPAEFDPREKIVFSVRLSNLNMLNISDLTVLLFSESRLIQAQMETALAPLASQKRIVLETEIDPHTKPQRDKATIALKYKDAIIATYENIEIEIKGYEDIAISEDTSSKFLGKKQEILIENNGNYPINRVYKKEMGIFRRIFTKADPGYYIIRENGKSFLAWDYSLSPKENKVILVTTSYVSLFVVFAVAFLALLLYFILRSPLQCKKNIDVSKRGDSTVIKVKLSIKNRSSSEITNITIKEIIPPLMLVSRESQLGVIQPSKIIKHKTKGTLLEWSIDRLEPFEERLIIYKATTKISIIGEIIIKSALAKFSYKGREKSTKSNSYVLDI